MMINRASNEFFFSSRNFDSFGKIEIETRNDEGN